MRDSYEVTPPDRSVHAQPRGLVVEPVAVKRPAVLPMSSAFAGYRFPPEVILLAVRWYLRYGLSYRDVEELLAERGIEVDHVPSTGEGAGPGCSKCSATGVKERQYVQVDRVEPDPSRNAEVDGVPEVHTVGDRRPLRQPRRS
ncbi:MAG: hypothetical protein ACI8Y4_004699 [Candidatus Poriferisodalaceae bacterium]